LREGGGASLSRIRNVCVCECGCGLESLTGRGGYSDIWGVAEQRSQEEQWRARIGVRRRMCMCAPAQDLTTDIVE